MTFRLYTEDSPVFRSNAARILTDHGFDSFTILPASGYWHGVPENSAVIELYTDNRDAVLDSARAITACNHQQAVLVTATDDTETLVQGGAVPVTVTTTSQPISQPVTAQVH